MVTRPRGARLAAVVAAVVGLAGCTSSAPAPATTSNAAPGSSAASGSSAAAADPATTRAIAKAYASFFDSKAPLAVTERYLQHGTEFKAALIAQSHNPQAAGLSAHVTKVTLLSTNSAAVHFNLLSGGKVLLPNSPGNAAREDGQWKVAAKTFCELVQLTGHPPAACNDPKITDLPG
jgi:hypothetical protein